MHLATPRLTLRVINPRTIKLARQFTSWSPLADVRWDVRFAAKLMRRSTHYQVITQ
jgi:hypothetical protein